jgi:hypothetical protein
MLIFGGFAAYKIHQTMKAVEEKRSTQAKFVQDMQGIHGLDGLDGALLIPTGAEILAGRTPGPRGVSGRGRARGSVFFPF